MTIPMKMTIATLLVGAALCLAVHADDDKEIPPIPEPTFEDAAQGEEYAQGVKLLKGEDYEGAEKIFKKLSRSAPKGEPREAAERCLKEAEGGVAADKIRGYIAKEQWKKALDQCEKVIDEYEGTFAGEKIEEIRKACIKELYHVIADFEEEEAPQEGDRDRGYGRDTKIVEGSRKQGTVRSGDGALEWLTGRQFSFLSFSKMPEDLAEGYKALTFSVRCNNPKSTPQLRILFDCQEGDLRWVGEGGRRGGRAARLFQRLGFHTAIPTSASWQDIRIDLRQFEVQGDVTWKDVKALRILHMPGAEGRLIIDDVRLEKR